MNTTGLNAGKPRVLYVLWTFPQLSQTYIKNEIEALTDKYDINVFTAQEPDFVTMDAPDTTRDRIATSQQYYAFGFGSARQYFCGNT